MSFILKMEKDVRVPLRLLCSHKAFAFLFVCWFWRKSYIFFLKISQSKQKEATSSKDFIPGKDPMTIAPWLFLITA